MKNRKLLYIVILISAAGFINGQDLSGISGAFTDPGFGARPSAMGGAFTAVSNDVHSVIYNPAGLMNIDKKQALFSYRNQLGLIGYNYFAAAMPVDKRSAIGTGLIVSGDKAMREYTLQASYARKFDLVSTGVSLKLRYASFGNNGISDGDYIIFEQDEIAQGRIDQVKGDAVGFGLDLGVKAMITEKLSFGVVCRDLLSPVYWDSHNDNAENGTDGKYTEAIPAKILIGAAYGIGGSTLIAADYVPSLDREVDNRMLAGIESVLFNIVALRAGTQTFFNNLKDEKYSFGLGLKVELMNDLTVNVDYTYQLEELANSQIFALGLEF